MLYSPEQLLAYRQQVSIRWSALETLLYGMSSIQSDIWSYGVVP